MKLNPEYKPKYVYLYAYSASVYEVTSGKKRKVINKDDLKSTIQAVDKVQSICSLNKSSTELIAEVTSIYQCIRYWISWWMCLIVLQHFSVNYYHSL